MQPNHGEPIMKLEDKVNQLCRVLEEMEVQDASESTISISGVLEIDSIIRDEYILESYRVKIDIPNNYPRELPVIKELSSKIDEHYSHVNLDNSLCLATDVDMHVQLSPCYSLLDYVTKFVIPYFISHEYHKKYNIFPFGERAHGIEGVFEFYREFFKIEKFNPMYDLLHYTSTKRYRGHVVCPCGSNERVRKCHGERIQSLQKEDIFPYVQRDFQVLYNGLKQFILDEKRQSIEKYLYTTK